MVTVEVSFAFLEKIMLHASARLLMMMIIIILMMVTMKDDEDDDCGDFCVYRHCV